MPTSHARGAAVALLLAASLLAVPAIATPLTAQAPTDSAADVAAFARAVSRARVKLAAERGAIWGATLDTIPWLAVRGAAMYASADPRDSTFLAAGDGLWAGRVPRGVAAANTGTEWRGRRWAMVRLPLPTDPLAADRLLVHELWHAAQPAVLPMAPAGEGAAGAALLDEPGGRVWLQLEIRALAAALDAAGTRRDDAIADALVFRARRYALASPEERDRERLLDLSEGLAEYTGWTVGGGGEAALAAHLRDDAPRVPSWVRAFPYYTGPAYGLLAEARAGRAWTRPLRDRPDLQLRMAELLGARGRGLAAHLALRDTAALARAAHRAAARYGRDALVRAERDRWTAQQTRLALLRSRFVDGPTLRLRPASLRIVFDPNRQTSLGEAGTVMAGFAWTSPDGGALEAPDGALVTTTWSEARVSLDGVTAALTEGRLAAPLALTGSGWRATIPAGWVVAREGRSWVVKER